MPVDLKQIQSYLHAQIPITGAMGIQVAAIDGTGVRLWAPLSANINHHSTVFGGSASAVAILSAWTLLFSRLRDDPQPWGIVIQRNSIEYLRPMDGDFEAYCLAPAEPEWNRFMHSLSRRGRARISLHSELRIDGELAGTFHGTYVASRMESAG